MRPPSQAEIVAWRRWILLASCPGEPQTGLGNNSQALAHASGGRVRKAVHYVAHRIEPTPRSQISGSLSYTYDRIALSRRGEYRYQVTNQSAMNPSSKLSIQVGKELDVQDFAESVFADEVARRQFRFVRAFTWETSERKLTFLPGAVPLFRHLGIYGQGQETFLLDDALCYLQLRGDDLFLRVAAHAEVNLDVELLLKSFYPPVLPRKDRCEAEISFWRTGANGPRRTRRTVEVEAWQSIERNYSSQTRSRIDPL